MAESQKSRILAGRPAVDFIGRGEAAERLFAHARSSNAGLLLLSTPGAGATELLKQTYDRLFRQQQEVIPFYFSVRPTMRSGRDIAASFLEEFIRQLVAFRRQDPSVFRSPGGLDELAELSLNIGGFWIDRLIDTARTAWSAPDGGPSFIRNCLAAPIRAASNDARSVVILDHVHHLPDVDGGGAFFDEFKEIFDNAGVPFVLSGHRRFLHGQVDCERMELDHLGIQDAARVVEVFAEESRIALSDEARDLVAVQLGRNASLMRHLVRTASDNGVALSSFYAVEKAYADALFGGRIGREFDASFASACRSSEVERRVVSMLFDGQVSEG